MDPHIQAILIKLTADVAENKTLLKDIPVIKQDVHEIRESVTSLRIKVATISASIGALSALAVRLLVG